LRSQTAAGGGCNVEIVPPKEEVVIRATPMTVAIIFLNAWFFSTILFGAGLGVALHRRHHTLIWICVASGALLVGTATAARLQARFDGSGVRARNALRSFGVWWPDVVAIRLIPAVWYCSDPSWSATMLEVETTDGRRFPLRCCTHLSRGKAEHLCTFLNQQAAEFHFEVPHSLTQLSGKRVLSLRRS